MVEKAKENSRKKEPKEESVEQNLSESYIPKAKLGNMGMANPVDPELVKQMDKTKKDLDTFKEKITKQFSYIEAIGMVPAQASKLVEEEYEIIEEDAKKGLMHLLVIIPEDQFKEIQKVKLECIKLAKGINEKMWVNVVTPVDIWNLCLDSKFDVVEALAMSYPILDKGILGALRVAEIHRTMVLKKFEKYVTSYVIGGSLVRGTTKPTSDIDVFIVINDTDVKRMSRFELKEKLRSVIFQYIQEAEAIAGVKNKLSPQVYLLTDFWESVKDAHPVMFTFIRDGIPLYDMGTFLPWKTLLRMGKIKPSPEALDMFMSSGDKLEETIKKRIFDIATLDLFWGISTPTQGLMMLYGKAPGNVYDTVKEFRELFVEKEKLIEKKYADILEEICIKVWKGFEHGKLKPGDIDGKELDRLSNNAIDYMKRLKKLRTQIEKKVQEKQIGQVYKDVFGMLESMLDKKTEVAILKSFEQDYVKKGKMPQRYLDGLNFIIKTKKEFEAIDKDKKKTLTMKEMGDIDQARKVASEIINVLVEHSQRHEFLTLNKKRFLAKSKDKQVELFFLNKLFMVEGPKISVLENSKFKASTIEELNKAISESKQKVAAIKNSEMQALKEYLGDFELISE